MAVALAVLLPTTTGCHGRDDPTIRQRLDTLEAAQAKLLAESKATNAQLAEIRNILRGGARGASPPLPTAPLSLIGAPIRGNTKAVVAIIEYSDFQCPYCGAFARETLPGLEAAYISTRKVLLAFRNVPIPELHPQATTAAEAAMCAADQGKFWEMHDALFENQRQLDAPSLVSRATKLRLDVPSFTACLQNGSAARVQRDVTAARALGVNVTPTFLIGRIQADGTILVTQRIEGAKSLAAFQSVLDPLLALAKN
jgi:protein-disulfide isomerase